MYPHMPGLRPRGGIEIVEVAETRGSPEISTVMTIAGRHTSRHLPSRRFLETAEGSAPTATAVAGGPNKVMDAADTVAGVRKRKPGNGRVPSLRGHDLTVWRLGRAVTRGNLRYGRGKNHLGVRYARRCLEFRARPPP